MMQARLGGVTTDLWNGVAEVLEVTPFEVRRLEPEEALAELEESARELEATSSAGPSA